MPRRPHFLLIVADDQTHRSLHALNHPGVHTPNLDRLAARGTCFTRARHQGSWQGAVCVASRAMLHTGRAIYRCGGDDCGDHVLLGEHLRRYGYRTAGVGKWHNGAASRARSFAQDLCHEGGMYASSPFDFEALAPRGDPAVSAYLRPAPGNRWRPDDRGLGGHWLDAHPPRREPAQHSSARWADRAIGVLTDHAAAGVGPDADPLFLYLAFHAPHDPRQAPAEDLERYPPGEIELPPNVLPRHPFDQGDFALRDEQLAPWPRTDEVVRTHLCEYYAILTHMDRELGRVFAALDAAGLADDTVVCFTADHGLAVGQHGLMGKQNQYEHSLGVPLIWAGPGVPVGERRDALCYQHSTFATACDLLGLAPPGGLDFPGLTAAMHDPRVRPHDAAFGAYRDFQRSVRDDTHKLIVYPHLPRLQLFDLAADPWETRDLAASVSTDPAVNAVAQRLFERLQQLQQDVGDTLDLTELGPVPLTGV